MRCESPNCGAEIPLVRSFWLCKKANRKRALRYQVVRHKGARPEIRFEVFEPKSGKEVPSGTVTRAKAACLACNIVLPPERVRAQLAAQRGGADAIFDEKGRRTGGARLLAVVMLKPGEQGRQHRLPTEADYQAVWKAQGRLKKILDEWERGGRKGLCPVPDEPTPAGGGSGARRAFSVQKYGMLRWGDLFTARQKVGLETLAGIIERKVRGHPELREILALVISRLTDKCAALVYWHNSGEFVDHVFARQALIAHWNTAEAPVPADVGFDGAVDWVAKFLESQQKTTSASVRQADACQQVLLPESAQLWFTDAPYYDAVPYADLSDFFFVWLKRALPDHRLLCDPFDPSNPLTPERREAVQDETKRDDGRPKDRSWFEEKMAQAFAEGRRVLSEDGIGSVVFAHKTTEGWEALLSGMIRGGWRITGSWPIATEVATGHTASRSRVRCPRHQGPPGLPPASRRSASRRLGRSAPQTTQTRRRLDGAPAIRGRARRGPGLRLHWPRARDLQPLPPRRNRGRPGGQTRAGWRMRFPLSILWVVKKSVCWTPCCWPCRGDSMRKKTPNVERVIQRMVRRIVRQFQPERIILFGSHARGEAGPDSDVDLLVVVPAEGKKREKQLDIRRALRDFAVPVDIVVSTPEEFSWRQEIVGTIEYPAVKEGKVLYARS